MTLHNQLDIFSILDSGQEIDSNVVTPLDSRWNETLEYFSKATIFGFDLETYGEGKQDALNPFKGFIRIISVGLDNGLCLLVDLGGFLNKITNEKRIENFLNILEKQLFNNNVIKCGHNLKFDMVYMLAKYGYHTRNVRDTMLISQVLWSGLGVDKAKIGEDRRQRCKLSHSLKAVALRVGLEVDKTEQKSNWGWDLTNKQINYAAKDSLIVIEIYKRLKELIKKENLVYSASVECLACPVFAEIEYGGFCVNEQELQVAISLYKEAQANSLKPWKEEFPQTNWASPSQVKEVLNKKYNWDLEKANDAALQRIDFPSVKGLLDARSLGISLKYLEGIQQNLFGGCVRSQYTQIAAAGTGRSSSENINLQNPSKLLPEHEAIGLPSVRSVFKAPQGFKLVIADLSQCINENCLIPVLGRGMTPLKDIREGEFVYGYENGNVVFTKVQQVHLLKYTGKMYDFCGEFLRQRVTENHCLYFKDGDYLPIPEVIDNKRWSDIVVKANPVENPYPNLYSNAELQFAVAVAADGTFSQNPECYKPGLKFHFHKERKVQRLNEILSALGYQLEWYIRFNTRYGCNEYSLNKIPDKLKELAHRLVPGKVLPRTLLNLNTEQRELVIKELCFWDGSILTKPGAAYDSYQFCSYKIQEIDIVQELLLQHGIRSNRVKKGKVLTWNDKKENPVACNIWVNVIRNRPNRKIYNEYDVVDENVGCLTTTTSNFYYLTEKGTLELTGNCHARVSAHMSGDKTLSKAYNKGIDNHLIMTAKLFQLKNFPLTEKEIFEIYKQKNHPLYKKIKQVRDQAKISFYSFLNQAGKIRLQQAFKGFRIEVALEDCETLIKLLRKTYSGLYKYILKRVEEANEVNKSFSLFVEKSGNPLAGYYGEIRGLTGRRQYCKKSKSNFDPSKQEIAFTDSIAYMWLSSEADMLKHAMGQILLEFDNHPEWEARFCNMCHDELDILCKEECAEEVANIVGITIKECLERWITSIPVEESGLEYKNFIANNWSEK